MLKTRSAQVGLFDAAVVMGPLPEGSFFALLGAAATQDTVSLVRFGVCKLVDGRHRGRSGRWRAAAGRAGVRLRAAG